MTDPACPNCGAGWIPAIAQYDDGTRQYQFSCGAAIRYSRSNAGAWEFLERLEPCGAQPLVGVTAQPGEPTISGS